LTALFASSSSAVTSTGVATIHPTSVVAFRLPAGGYQLAPGLGAMWIVRGDGYHDTLIYRVDPTTNTRRLVGHLTFPATGVAVGYGSLWVADYFGNAIWRVSPRGRAQARIPTGLQPLKVHAAFGSVWVGNLHGHSVTRIDPRTDTVSATDSAGDPTRFCCSPKDITSDSRRIYVASSDQSALQSIDPATNATTTPAGTVDQFCGPLTFIGGSIWNSDRCTNTLYRISPAGVVRSHITYGPTPGSGTPQVLAQTRFADRLWVAVDKTYDHDTSTGTHGVLDERDPHDGNLLGTVPVGGDLESVIGAFGSLWTFDAHTSTVRRLTLPPTP
jgi:streptogramin lyase